MRGGFWQEYLGHHEYRGVADYELLANGVARIEGRGRRFAIWTGQVLDEYLAAVWSVASLHQRGIGREQILWVRVTGTDGRTDELLTIIGAGGEPLIRAHWERGHQLSELRTIGSSRSENATKLKPPGQSGRLVVFGSAHLPEKHRDPESPSRRLTWE
jgi:hypothetical protein